MRRLLKARELGLPEGDVSTLESVPMSPVMHRRGRTAGHAEAERRTARPAAPDAAHPPVRGAMRRAVQRREDPRLPAPLHRRGGRRRRRHGGPDDRRTPWCRPTASTATRWRGASRPTRSWPRCTARSTGCSRGRGGSMHLFDASRRFYGGNAIVGGGLPLAVGLALADQMRRRDRVTVCFFGDGAVAEGEFHESLNLAALWQLPVLFCCENNLYAMGTALDRAHAADRPGIAGRRLRHAGLGGGRHGRRWPSSEAAAHARWTRSAPAADRSSWSCAPTGSGPTRCTTRTATGTRPRSQQWSKRDPIDAARGAAARRRRARPTTTWPPWSRTLAAEIDARRRAPREAAPRGAGRATDPLRVQPSSRGPAAMKTTYREAHARGDPRRDARATSGCSSWARTSARTAAPSASASACWRSSGPERIRDTPLSESGFVGAGIGAALGGHAARSSRS